jgi:hypothetical protein
LIELPPVKRGYLNWRRAVDVLPDANFIAVIRRSAILDPSISRHTPHVTRSNLIGFDP